MQLTVADLFLKRNTLLSTKTNELSKITIDFEDLKTTLKTQFQLLQAAAKQTDKSFSGAVNAQETKQLKGLLNLEKRLLKAEKRIYKETLDRIIDLQEALFPGESLQERKQNFAEFYIEVGSDLISKISKELDPFSNEFSVVIVG